MSKKIFLLFLFCLIVAGNSYATIKGSRFKITESEKEFDVIYYLTEDIEKGQWPWPDTAEDAKEIKIDEVIMLLKGIDFFCAYESMKFESMD